MFYNLIFPESISIKSTRSIKYDTIIHSSKNGSELRISNLEYPMLSYNIVNDIKNKKELETITNFFKLVKGRAGGFKFKDWLDYEAKSQNIAVTDGEIKEFQLIKTYNYDNKIEIRKITKPIEGSVKIFVDDVDITTSIVVDYDTGIIKFSIAPEKDKIIKADFNFYVPVRFDTDTLEIVMINTKVGTVKDLKIVEIVE